MSKEALEVAGITNLSTVLEELQRRFTEAARFGRGDFEDEQ